MKWTKKEDEIIRKNYGKLSNKIIKNNLDATNFINRTIYAIKHRAKKLGLTKPPSEVWSSKEDEIIINYYGKDVSNVLVLLINDISSVTRTAASVRRRANKLGLRIVNSLPRKHKLIDQNYFFIPNLENSYWAGFLAADGYINTKGYNISVTIKDTDINILYKLVRALRYGNSFKMGVSGCGQSKERVYRNVSVSISSAKKLIRDLDNNFNVITKKSLVLKPPNNLNEKFGLAYIVGFIDGDGWVGYAPNKKGYPRLDIASGSKDILVWIESMFNKSVFKDCTTKNGGIYRNKDGVFHYKIAGNKVVRIFELLRSTYINKLYRKKIVIDNILKQPNSHFTVDFLKSFEKEIEKIYSEGCIRAPVHLSSNNELQLIEIFDIIEKNDWVFCGHRSHYHALLKGVSRELVKKEILKGNSISLCFPEYRFFSSGIMGGTLSWALGVALSIKMRGSGEKVWAFCGDTASMMGTFDECQRYAEVHELPISFVIEDNGVSIHTPTEVVWGNKNKLERMIGVKKVHFVDNNLDACVEEKGNIFYYKYENIYPHQGINVWVEF